MTISELIKGLRVIKTEGSLDLQINGIACDSRAVREGFLFVAVRGYSVDGHQYIKDALDRGAAAIVAQQGAAMKAAEDAAGRAAYIEVPDSREALALISAAFYGHPSGRLSLVGITGTNGKTTTGFVVKNIIEAAGERAGLLGTICYMTGGRTESARNTTPESLDMQRYLDEMARNNMKYAAVEVSSHALALKRVEGCTFRVAAFTSFSQDHLDFHRTMDEYFEAKKRLFSYLAPGGTAVLNLDDPMIRPLAKGLRCNVITCGTAEGAMIRAENIEELKSKSRDTGHAVPSGLSFDVLMKGERFRIDSKLIGRFNVNNILVSIGVAHALGFGTDVIQNGIRSAKPVQGRLENIDEGQDFLCIVDYAHTEDALRKVLEEARRITDGKVITVFGCGGDRDRTKRPLMGAAASEMSDRIIVTSDNPRSEEPMEIIKDITGGMRAGNYSIQPDRERAIEEAVSMAGAGDTLLVAGKGHEDYQEIKGVRHHLSDREILRKALRKLSEGGKEQD
ncbi:MAG: UDP-N-acetylmuramoyl-L-alanyl-D-glutamate--2,6-diaminopimelate ligase [Nitrospirota bacterium]|nr:UDP-N-acetylmuramoyl-L-alanyl-D-glutamate--2,6-diaminopimelate ligase [Nitrospirota bacterium]